MKPNSISNQYSLHSVPLKSFLDPLHELVLLELILNWRALEARFGAMFKPGRGRPPLATRLMAALHLLKYLYDESDETVLARMTENPYWQHFCGFSEFQHSPPCDASSLSRWRRRIGADVEVLLRESLAAAKGAGMAKPADFQRVVLDTTVQEKAVTPPTDAKLMSAMQRRLLREAAARDIAVPRPYRREMKRLQVLQARLRHNRKHKLANRKLRRMRTLLRRVERQIGRDFARLDEALVHQLQRAARLRAQSRGRLPGREKIYSVHAPEVECIGKGKPHKPWEFGVKVALATTTTRHPLVLAALTAPGAPYDGATAQRTLDECERMTGEKVYLACADKGYRGAAHQPKEAALFISGLRKLGGTLRRFVRRRVVIEPVIGHQKSEHKLERNRLKGEMGDRINAVLSAAAWNLAQLMRWLAAHPGTAARLLAAFARLMRLLARLAVAHVRNALEGAGALAGLRAIA